MKIFLKQVAKVYRQRATSSLKFNEYDGNVDGSLNNLMQQKVGLTVAECLELYDL